MNYDQGRVKSPVFIIAIVLASIAVLLSFTVLILKLTEKKKVQPIQEEQAAIIDIDKDLPLMFDEEVIGENEAPPEESIALEENIAPEELPIPEDSDKGMQQGIDEMEAPIDPDSALYYVPTPGMILTYMKYFPDGDIAEVKEVIGQMEIGILASIAEMLTDDMETLYIYHYVESEDGIYLLDHEDAEYITLWLPNKFQVGDTWEYDYMKYEILEMGVNVEAGGKIFEDCIMRKETIEEMDFSRISYIAPGYGEVYSEYEGGSIEFELIHEETDDHGLAMELIGGSAN